MEANRHARDTRAHLLGEGPRDPFGMVRGEHADRAIAVAAMAVAVASALLSVAMRVI